LHKRKSRVLAAQNPAIINVINDIFNWLLILKNGKKRNRTYPTNEHFVQNGVSAMRYSKNQMG